MVSREVLHHFRGIKVPEVVGWEKLAGINSCTSIHWDPARNSSHHYDYLDGGNSNIFYFHPEPWGRWTHFDEHIFQMGRFNHQVVIIFLVGDPYIINLFLPLFLVEGSIRYHPEQKFKTPMSCGLCFTLVLKKAFLHIWNLCKCLEEGHLSGNGEKLFALRLHTLHIVTTGDSILCFLLVSCVSLIPLLEVPSHGHMYH